MKVLVTGADGYIACGVIEEILKRGHEVIGWGLRPSNLNNAKYKECLVDVFEVTEQEISDLNPDIVIHLAWRNGFVHNNDSHIDDLSGHYHFIQRCISAGVSRIAVMGTMHEVGYYEGAIDSNTPCNPTTPYGIAKNALRQLFLSLCNSSNVQGLWMRGFYLVSSDGRGNSIFSKIVRAAKEGKRTFPFTSGKTKYDFLSYDEFCKMTVDYALNDQITGIVNICSGRPVSLGDEVESFIKANKFDIKLDYGAYPDRSYDSPAIWGKI